MLDIGTPGPARYAEGGQLASVQEEPPSTGHGYAASEGDDRAGSHAEAGPLQCDRVGTWWQAWLQGMVLSAQQGNAERDDWNGAGKPVAAVGPPPRAPPPTPAIRSPNVTERYVVTRPVPVKLKGMRPSEIPGIGQNARTPSKLYAASLLTSNGGLRSPRSSRSVLGSQTTAVEVVSKLSEHVSKTVTSTFGETWEKIKRIDVMNLDFQVVKKEFESRADEIQIVSCLVNACLKLYGALMATMLAVFVPQTCPPSERYNEYHTCTIHENFVGITPYNKIVLAMNFFCFLFFVGCEAVLFRREVWLIRFLEEVPDKPAENLPTALKELPMFTTSLRKWNLRACHAALLFLGAMVINLGLSSVLVLFYRYAGLRTWTALISNTMLLAWKVANNANIAFRCWNNETARAVSLYTQKLVVFNEIDKKVKEKLGQQEAGGGRHHLAPTEV